MLDSDVLLIFAHCCAAITYYLNLSYPSEPHERTSDPEVSQCYSGTSGGKLGSVDPGNFPPRPLFAWQMPSHAPFTPPIRTTVLGQGAILPITPPPHPSGKESHLLGQSLTDQRPRPPVPPPSMGNPIDDDWAVHTASTPVPASEGLPVDSLGSRPRLCPDRTQWVTAGSRWVKIGSEY